ncbi:type II TA system antitoxin MqsA family protein [Uliginosibacterium sp. sgz301328]|uniref:type II TA system antitoxin MqsA family protein n=1 Tax=Uliginosibacterium sp. sgz301328 TaxID=3243764 RepID=UPI00359E6785
MHPAIHCPACGGAELVADARDLPYTCRDRTVVIPEVRGLYCMSCGEALLGAEESARVMNAMRAFSRQINVCAAGAELIVRVRKQLRLSQTEAGMLFGGSASTFSRYESGRVRPPPALVKLFKLLERHPELLAEIKDA